MWPTYLHGHAPYTQGQNNELLHNYSSNTTEQKDVPKYVIHGLISTKHKRNRNTVTVSQIWNYDAMFNYRNIGTLYENGVTLLHKGKSTCNNSIVFLKKPENPLIFLVLLCNTLLMWLAWVDFMPKLDLCSEHIFVGGGKRETHKTYRVFFQFH